MKRFLFFLVMAAWCCQGVFAQPKARVSECFELTGVAFRLSGYDVFVHSEPQNYVADMDAWFSKYSNHDLVKFIKKCIGSRTMLEFNMITDMAADIEITPKGIVYTEKWITNYASESYGQRKAEWSKAELKEYLRLLNKFYRETKFHQFYTAHRQFYDSAESRLQVLVDQIDTAWFMDFFGQPFEMANIWVVPSNGRHNFALDRHDKDGKSYHNCAIGCSSTDAAGFPLFDHRIFKILIHEICHNYNNPACDLYKDLFRGICDTLYSYVGEDLEKNYYGGQNNILYEGLNRLCEYTYYREHHTFLCEVPETSSQWSAAQWLPLSKEAYYEGMAWERRVRWEEEKGFLWLHELIDFGQAYRLNRDKYHTYAEFVPEIVGFLRQVATDMESYYLPKRAMFYPQVVSTFPANGSVVDTNITKVVVVFSMPMQEAQGFKRVEKDSVLFLPLKPDSYGKAYWEWMKDTTQPEPDYDAFEHSTYWENEYTFVILLAEPLKPKSRYGLRLTNNFPSKKYWTGCKPFDLIFETR